MIHTMELTYRNGYLTAQARQILIVVHKSKRKLSHYKILGFHIFLRDPFRRTFFGTVPVLLVLKISVPASCQIRYETPNVLVWRHKNDLSDNVC